MYMGLRVPEIWYICKHIQKGHQQPINQLLDINYKGDKAIYNKLDSSATIEQVNNKVKKVKIGDFTYSAHHGYLNLIVTFESGQTCHLNSYLKKEIVDLINNSTIDGDVLTPNVEFIVTRYDESFHLTMKGNETYKKLLSQYKNECFNKKIKELKVGYKYESKQNSFVVVRKTSKGYLIWDFPSQSPLKTLSANYVHSWFKYKKSVPNNLLMEELVNDFDIEYDLNCYEQIIDRKIIEHNNNIDSYKSNILTHYNKDYYKNQILVFENNIKEALEEKSFIQALIQQEQMAKKANNSEEV